ncbi:MAG: alpha/beta hydrolase [Gammaproteobacteria bacterium]|nr:alpha/beta hydrolase [Gammaproteobacteria bacterium]
MSTNRITRHFASITTGRWGARQVHYRRVGSGPVVIMFHQSPLSSRDMLAAMERWQMHFTCIAPDSPGFGLSDAMGVGQAEMGDFAEAAIEFMDAIGVERAAVYGFHTGAMISGAIAAAYPERIVCAAANGYVILAESEKTNILQHYLPAFIPAWDGSHLVWLWSRMRDQTIFFPWFAKSQAARLRGDVPPAEMLHAGLLDFMRSGDNYRVGYRAAFTMRSDLALRNMRTPMLVTAYDTDVLSAHLPRIRNASEQVTVKAGGTIEETLDLCRNYIKRHKPPKGPKITAPAKLHCRLRQDYVDIVGGQLRLRRNDDVGGRTVLVLHDAVGSSETVATIAGSFIGHRPVIALNLPGHGESDDTLPRRKSSIAAYAESVNEALTALGLDTVDVLGVGAGASVGLELALRHRDRVHVLAMVGVAYVSDTLAADLVEHVAPDIEPDWYGGYLLKAWHLVRDKALFFPWYERKGSTAIRQEPQVNPVQVQQRVLELFRSPGWQRLSRAQFDYPLRKRLTSALGRAAVPIVFAASDLDPQRDNTWRAAADFAEAKHVQLPDAESKWAATLLPNLDGSH